MIDSLPLAILLDLDDTILAYDDGIDECWQAACDRFADRVGEASRLREIIREYSRWYWSDADRHRVGRLNLPVARRAIVAEALRRMGRCDEKLAGEIGDFYSTLREERIRPFPGAIEALGEFRRRGHRLGLVTNGAADVQRRKIARFGLEKLLDCIVIEGQFGCGKPQAAVFLCALAQLDVKSEDTCMIGDNLQADVAGAQNVGICGIWNDFRREGLPSDGGVRPDRIIHALSDLT